MKKLFKTAIFFFSLVNVISFADTAKQIDKFFDVSGFNRQVEQYPALFKKGIDMAYQKKADIPQDVKSKIESSALKYFTVEIIKSSIKDQLIKSISETDMNLVLKFYDTDIANYFTELEVKGTSTATLEKLQSFKPETINKSVRDEIDKIYFGLNMLDDTMDTQKLMMISMFQILTAELPKEKQKSIDEINELLSKTTEATKPMYEKMIKNNLYLVYGSAPLSKLKVYTEYLNSAVVKNFYKQFIKGKQEAYKTAAAGFGGALIEAFKK